MLAHRFVVLHQVFVEKHLFALRFKVSANHVGSVSVIAKIRERVAQTSHFGRGEVQAGIHFSRMWTSHFQTKPENVHILIFIFPSSAIPPPTI